jgi:hypothetical protein
MSLQTCPQCTTYVLPLSDGRCPACQAAIASPYQNPTPADAPTPPLRCPNCSQSRATRAGRCSVCNAILADTGTLRRGSIMSTLLPFVPYMVPSDRREKHRRIGAVRDTILKLSLIAASAWVGMTAFCWISSRQTPPPEPSPPLGFPSQLIDWRYSPTRLDHLKELADYHLRHALLGGLSALVWAAVAVILLWRGSKKRYARKLERQTAFGLLSQDDRPPIVYLRSFSTDRPSWFVHFGLRSPEEKLARRLHRLAPFVAFGQPGELAAELGAYRLYVQDDHWRDLAEVLVETATFVVLRPGLSGSLVWELRTCARLLLPSRLILDVRRVRIRSIWPHLMEAVQQLRPLPVGRGNVIRFAENWIPLWVPNLKVALSETMRPTA